MKLLLDENLSPRLIPRLVALFPESTHVRDAGLREASDHVIWIWARENEMAIVTADSDFLELSRRLGPPPKLIHLQRCNFPAQVIEELLRQNALRIAEFGDDPRARVLSLHFRR